MEWKDESTKRAIVFESEMLFLSATIVRGHVDAPDEWLLSTRPDIFSGFNRMGNVLHENEAKEKAEHLITERLARMLGGLYN